jgi:DNA replication and repair protein RecF
MKLARLEINRVRNLDRVQISPSQHVNLILGENASGKTSFLESIYLLSRGRSFRTVNIRSVIQHGAESLLLHAEVRDESPRRNVALGLERSPRQTHIRINRERVKQASKLAQYLPVQIITPEAHQLLEDGPQQRRKYLDWGLFHVEPRFFPTWQHYHRILKQRNAALRRNQRESDIRAWDAQLLAYAETLTAQRLAYVKALEPWLEQYANTLLGQVPDFHYRAGWRTGETLAEVLEHGLDADRERGHTRYGPHRADLVIQTGTVRVQDVYSRGQQKLLVCVLRLAQIRHLAEAAGIESVVLVDDLAAELDNRHRQQLFEVLEDSGAQLFITATDASMLPERDRQRGKTFHVEHGQVREVV